MKFKEDKVNVTVARTMSVGLFVIVVAMIALASSLSGQRTCCQGDRWLKWSEDVRATYVEGYSYGYTEGLGESCRRAAKNWPAQPKPGYEIEVRCLQDLPDFSKGPEALAKAVTEFYKRYPGDRDIRITEVLALLAQGLTLEQIHNHPFIGHESPRDKPSASK